ncbi:hypothetical protein [Corynebacterium deserti]|uniref:hypothetical protein n=1 Tax=Corynebacterium deserti TaxID=1408191 RepID=UPI000A67F065|nr:hypothetical protein [Corynebacterium deserti]
MKKAKNSTTVVSVLAVSALTLASISSTQASVQDVGVKPEHNLHAGTTSENA